MYNILLYTLIIMCILTIMYNVYFKHIVWIVQTEAILN